MTHGRRLSAMLAALVLALGGALLPSPSAGAALLLDGAATVAGTFTSLPPSRVLDTRTGTGAPKAKLAPHGTVTLRVTGTGGVPTTGVAAVVLNLTVTDPTTGGHITAHPAGTTPPTASNLNFTPRQTIANLAVVKVGTGGRITLHNNAPGTTHLIADVAGYYLSGAATAAGTFTSLPPSRVLDTRTGTGAPKAKLAPHGTVTLRVTGTGGVPTTGVAAVVLNLTVTDPTTGGHITAHPAGTTPPTASNLNFTPRQTIANLAVVKVGTGGRITLHNNAPGTTHLIADVAGYYLSGAATAAGTFTSLPPSRVLDTRTGTGAPKAKLAPHGTVTLRVTGTGGVPTTGVAAVVLNLTVTDPTTGGHITAHPAGTTPPTASNLNFTPRQTIANLAVVKVGTGGRITLHNNAPGTTHLIADVAGYYRADTTPPGPVTLATVSSRSTTSVTLSWANPVDRDFAGVVVRRARGANPPSTPTDGVLVGAPDRPATSLSDTGLSAGTAYSYALFARDSLDNHSAAAVVRTSTATEWEPSTVIDPKAGGLTSTSCATPSFCAATDAYGNVLTFDGTTWSAPTLVDTGGRGLTAVSCPSARFCAALDASGSALSFDGTAWSAPVRVDPGGQGLTSVSCPTDGFCAAVDQAGNALTFDGTTWSAPTSIDPLGKGLTSVSCPTDGFCAAVGNAGNALTFDGTTWSTPVSIDPDGRGLSSVSCPSTTFCAAVDRSSRVLTFDGSSWTAPALLEDPFGRSLSAVSCATSTFCVATSITTGVFVFDGTSWTLTPRLEVNTAGIDSVSCPTTTFCVAAGHAGTVHRFDGVRWHHTDVDPPRGHLRAVSCPTPRFCAAVDGAHALTSDGATWSAPVFVGGQPGLASVSCPSASFCAAVGLFGDAFTFDGVRWSDATRMNGSGLTSVSCTSASFCAAVGFGVRRWTAATFDGSRWTAATRNDEAQLRAVACTSPSSCLAVGDDGTVVSYDGTTWSVPTRPDIPTGLMSLSCPSATFCAAAGRDGLVTTFDGATWSAPVVVEGGRALTSVSCSSSSSCTAVDGTGAVSAWDGSSWSLPLTVSPTGLAAVSCPTASRCVAVGSDRAVIARTP